MRLLQAVLEIFKTAPKVISEARLIHAKDILGFFYVVRQVPLYFFVIPLDIIIVLSNVYTS